MKHYALLHSSFVIQDLRDQIINTVSMIAIFPFAVVPYTPGFVPDSNGTACFYPSFLTSFYAC